MPVARRMPRTTISDAERASIKREVLAEIRDAMYAGESLDDVREFLDERDPDPLSYEDIAAMSEEAITADWDRVSRVLEAGPGAGPQPFDHEPTSSRRQTGQQPTAGGGAGGTDAPTPITRQSLATMSHAELVARQPEIDAWLASGGANR